MIDKQELLDSLTNEIVISILEENGSPLYNTTIDRRTNQELFWFRTICHNGDSHKLCYFTQSKDFFCYTNCGKMDFFEFIKRVRNVKEGDFYEGVIKYLAEKVGKSTKKNRVGFTSSIDPSVREAIMGWTEKEEIQGRKNSGIILPVFDEKILNYYDHGTYYLGWLDEGISPESWQKFGIAWDEYRKYIIIPHRNPEGQLVGIRRRSLNPEDANNKYMPLFIEGKEYAHGLGLNLYGLYENKETIRRKQKAILVEGEKSVLLSNSFFGENSCTVATCGFNVSQAQIQQLIDLRVETVYLGFDKDFDERKEELYKKDHAVYKDYLRYKDRLYSLALRLKEDFHTFIIKDTKGLLGIKDSPFDKGKEVCEKIIHSAKKLR